MEVQSNSNVCFGSQQHMCGPLYQPFLTGRQIGGAMHAALMRCLLYIALMPLRRHCVSGLFLSVTAVLEQKESVYLADCQCCVQKGFFA